MSLDLVTAVEQLLKEKGDLLRRVDDIDAQLERARLAIGGRAVPSPKPAPNYKRDLRPDGSLVNEIYAALAAKEPRTKDDIASYVQADAASVHIQLHAMVQAGQIHRGRLPKGIGRPFIYARSEAAIVAFLSAPAPAAPATTSDLGDGDDDELGLPGASVEDAASTSLETDGSR